MSTSQNGAAQQEESKDSTALLYGIEAKRRRIDGQRIGDFIVKGLESVHFKIVSEASEINDENSGNYFAPKFLYWVSFHPPKKLLQSILYNFFSAET